MSSHAYAIEVVSLIDPSINPLTDAEIKNRYGFRNHRCMGHNGFTRDDATRHCTETLEPALVASATAALRLAECVRQEYRLSTDTLYRIRRPAELLLCPFHRPQFLENCARFWQIYKRNTGLTLITSPALEISQPQHQAAREAASSAEHVEDLRKIHIRTCHEDGAEHVPRRALSETCPICLCPLLDQDEGLEKLVWCKSGCGNSMHAECVEIWTESCRERSYEFEVEDEDPFNPADLGYYESANSDDEFLSRYPRMYQGFEERYNNFGWGSMVTCVVCRCPWASKCACDSQTQPDRLESALPKESKNITTPEGSLQGRGYWSRLASSVREGILRTDVQPIRFMQLRRRLSRFHLG